MTHELDDDIPCPLRLAIIKNIPSPNTTPVFNLLGARPDVELLVVYESDREPNRTWQPDEPQFQEVTLRSRLLDLSRFADDAYVHVPVAGLDEISRFEPHVVIASGAGVWSSPANLYGLMGRRRGRWAWVPWWGSFGRPHRSSLRRALEPWVRWFFRQADATIAYGTRAAHDLGTLGADLSRTVIVPNTSRVLPESDHGHRNSLAKKRSPRFLFVGQLVHRKGIDLLLQAFTASVAEELWIVGNGPERALVEQMAARDPRITYLGPVDDPADLARVYDACQVLVHPARYEVWGLVINEALARGLNVITTDAVGAADDLVTPATGTIVPAGSVRDLQAALDRAAASPGQSSVKTAGPELMSKWSMEVASQRLYEAALTGYCNWLVATQGIQLLA